MTSTRPREGRGVRHTTGEQDRLKRAVLQPVQCWDKVWGPSKNGKNIQVFKYVKSDRQVDFDDEDFDEDMDASLVPRQLEEEVGTPSAVPSSLQDVSTPVPAPEGDNDIEGEGNDQDDTNEAGDRQHHGQDGDDDDEDDQDEHVKTSGDTKGSKPTDSSTSVTTTAPSSSTTKKSDDERKSSVGSKHELDESLKKSIATNVISSAAGNEGSKAAATAGSIAAASTTTSHTTAESTAGSSAPKPHISTGSSVVPSALQPGPSTAGVKRPRDAEDDEDEDSREGSSQRLVFTPSLDTPVETQANTPQDYESLSPVPSHQNVHHVPALPALAKEVELAVEELDRGQAEMEEEMEETVKEHHHPDHLGLQSLPTAEPEESTPSVSSQASHQPPQQQYHDSGHVAAAPVEPLTGYTHEQREDSAMEIDSPAPVAPPAP